MLLSPHMLPTRHPPKHFALRTAAPSTLTLSACPVGCLRSLQCPKLHPSANPSRKGLSTDPVASCTFQSVPSPFSPATYVAMFATRCAAVCALLLLATPGILGLSQCFSQQLKQANIPPQAYGRKTNAYQYDPSKVDWASVISACKAIGEYEKRLHSFNIRSCFHDGLSINAQTHRGGMDGSLFTAKELKEASNGGFSVASLRVVMTVAAKYGTSWADALAVCGAVGIEELSGHRANVIGLGYKNFPVGRLDSADPTVGDVPLTNKDSHTYDDIKNFGKFWVDNGFSVEEGVALLGSHALFDNLGCSRSSTPGDDCNPDQQSCANDVRMFKLDEHFYKDACTGTVTILKKPQPSTKATWKDLANQEQEAKCQYTSYEYRSKFDKNLEQQLKDGKLTTGGAAVTWTNGNCGAAASLGISGTCPHRAPDWPFTLDDAHLARACQGQYPQVGVQYGQQVQAAMRRYLNVYEWDRVFVPAFIKMVSRYATWVNHQPMYIDGSECPSGYSSYGGCRTAWTNRDHLLPEVIHFTGPTATPQ